MAKISVLSLDKNYKYEYLTGKEILPPGQKKKWQKKLSLHILLSVKHLINK